MKSIGQILHESLTHVYILTEADKRFISSFGTSDKPVGLEEFVIFWNSLDEYDKTAIMLDYDPEEYPGTEGFKP